MTLHQGISYPGPVRANRLENNNKQIAPVTLMTQRELPGIRKPAAVRKNEFTHFPRPDAGFRCALYAQRASEAGCPEAVDCVIQATAERCLLFKLRSIRRCRGLGARSARKMIQWIIFSEGGPEGHGRGSHPSGSLRAAPSS